MSTSSAVRGLWIGGASNIIDYVTIASTGDSTDFGDLTVARHGCDGASGAS